MKINKILLLHVFLLLLSISCKELNENDEENNKLTSTSIREFNYLPTSTTNAIYKHTTYTLSYSEEHEQAEWIAYFLDKEDVKYVNYERPFFEVDKNVKTGSAHWRNYKNSGYNKGHLLPAGDRRKSYQEYEETFLTSNISPQKYHFNSGVWNRLEQKVRYWAEKYDGIYVVTAGVLTDNLHTIGYEKVAVPEYFYKVLLTEDKKKMIGFLVPHKKSNKPLYQFVVAVDEIEKMTELDFFPDLEDTIENNLEATSDYKDWSF